MKYKIFMSLAMLLAIIFSGCIQQDSIFERAEPYINKIVFNDVNLRAYANSIIHNCSSADKECQINEIYRHIVENYNYLSDPTTGVEFIQNPNETMQIKGGDCEDLTILLNSLLENIGIKTYIVLMENHICSLIYDVNVSNMWEHVKASLIEQVKEDWGKSKRDLNETFELQGWGIYYYGSNGTKFEDTSYEYMNITYEIDSSQPIDFYIVPSRNDYELHVDDKTFNYYTNYKKQNIKKDQGICTLFEDGGIMLDNRNWGSTVIHLQLTFEFQPSFDAIFKNKTITSYEIKNKTSIILDPTQGIYGFPGYSDDLPEEKIAIDAMERFYLE